jgi:hypothetical protein
MVEPGFASLVRKSSRYLSDDIEEAKHELAAGSHPSRSSPHSPVLSFTPTDAPAALLPPPGPKSKNWNILSSQVLSNPAAAAMQVIVREASESMLFRILSKEYVDRTTSELRYSS